MKDRFRLYGRDSAALDEQLTDSDREILGRYLKFCATTAGPGKVNDYRRCMLQFYDTLEKPLDQVTADDAVAFWALVNHAPHEANTKVMVRRTVKRFLKWFYRDLSMIEPLKNPRPKVNHKRVNKTTIFKPETEIPAMLRAADRTRDKALLALLYESAARPQEVRDLCWRSVDWDNREVHVYSTKVDDDRDLPLHSAIDYLRRWYEDWPYPDPTPEDYVFPALPKANLGSRGRHQPISVESINKTIKCLARRAGITRPVHTYLLRHTRLTELHQMGVKGLEHNKFAGHAPGSRQQGVYVHLDSSDMKRAIIEKAFVGTERGVDKDYAAPEHRVDPLVGNTPPPPGETRLRAEIDSLKGQLAEVLSYLHDSRNLMLDAQHQLRKTAQGTGNNCRHSREMLPKPGPPASICVITSENELMSDDTTPDAFRT